MNIPTHSSLMAFAAALLVSANVEAQPVIVTPPAGPPRPIGEPSETAEPGTGLPGTPAASSERAPFQWGRIVFRPHITYGFRYGNGILTSTNQEQKTVIQTIAPGLTIDLGEHWTFDYTPSISLYSDSAFEDSLNHSVSLGGRTTWNDWRLGATAGASVSSDPITETGTQTDQTTFSVGGSAGHALNQGFSFDLTGNFSARLTDEFTSSRDYSTLNWLNREWGPHLAAGIGIGAGFEDVDTGTDMLYQRLEGRILWHLTQKLHLTLIGGADIRQFSGSGRSTMVSPIFNTSLQYQIFETTSFSLSASRTVSASYFVNELTERTSLNAAINQRVLGRVYVTVSGGIGNTSYESTASSPLASNREDDYTSFGVSVGTGFGLRGSASVFYSRSRNSSNLAGFSYTSDQAGFQVGYRY